MYAKRIRRTRTVRTRRPYQRRFVRKTRRMVAPYRRRRPIGRTVIPFSPKWSNPLAQTKTFKLKYIDSKFDLSTTVGNGYRQFNVFRANSIYDPDVTGVGIQPYGHDELEAIYSAYTVYASKIKASFYVVEQCYKGVCTVIPSSDVALDHVDEHDLRMSPYAKQTIIDYNAGRKRANTIVSYCSTRKIFPEINTKDADFRAAMTDNPTIMWYWHVFFDTADVAVETSAYVDVEITYYCRLTRIGNSDES